VNQFLSKKTSISQFSIQRHKGETFVDFTINHSDQEILREVVNLSNGLESDIQISVYFEPIYGYMN